MNDQQYDQVCCNGQCQQGRKCPRYQEEKLPWWDNALTAFFGLLFWVLFVCFIIGYFHGAWRYI